MNALPMNPENPWRRRERFHPGSTWLFAAFMTITAATSSAMEAEDFADYVWGRAGDGSLIHRVSTGFAYDIDSGATVARLEGHEAAIAVASRGEPGTVYHISRAMLIYRHPQTDEVLAVYPGSDPLAQTSVSAYSYSQDGFVWRLGIPDSRTPPRRIPGDVSCEHQGSMLSCLRGTARDSREGMTLIEYRWTVDRSAASIEAAARSEFAEKEPPHPGISEGPVMIRLSSYRVPDWGSVPTTLKLWIDSEAPGFATLPADTNALIKAAGFKP